MCHLTQQMAPGNHKALRCAVHNAFQPIKAFFSTLKPFFLQDFPKSFVSLYHKCPAFPRVAGTHTPGTTRPSCSARACGPWLLPSCPRQLPCGGGLGPPSSHSWERNPSLLQGLADCFFRFGTLEMRTPIFLFSLTPALFGLGTLGKRGCSHPTT